jgi:ankyrin repeat protein
MKTVCFSALSASFVFHFCCNGSSCYIFYKCEIINSPKHSFSLIFKKKLNRSLLLTINLIMIMKNKIICLLLLMCLGNVQADQKDFFDILSGKECNLLALQDAILDIESNEKSVHGDWRKWTVLTKSDGKEKNNNSKSVLSHAIENCPSDVIEYLIEQGVSVDGGVDEVTPLNAAYSQANYPLMELLLNKGANPNLGKILMRVILNDDYLALKLLVEKGADVNLVVGGQTPLEFAAEHSRKLRNQIIKYLLESGANPRLGSVLHAVARHGDAELVNLVMSNGLDINLLGGEYACPPIIDAIDSRNAKTFTAMLGYNPSMDFRCKIEKAPDLDSSKKYPLLQYAVMVGKFAIVKNLMDYMQLDLNTTFDNGASLLHLVMKNPGGYDEYRLIAFRYSRNGGRLIDPLIDFLFEKQQERVKLMSYLIKKGISPNVRDLYGLTPLHYAVLENTSVFVDALISEGADMNAAEYRYGLTTLDLARIYDRQDIVKLLVSKDAKGKPADELMGYKQYCLLEFYNNLWEFFCGVKCTLKHEFFEHSDEAHSDL